MPSLEGSNYRRTESSRRPSPLLELTAASSPHPGRVTPRSASTPLLSSPPAPPPDFNPPTDTSDDSVSTAISAIASPDIEPGARPALQALQRVSAASSATNSNSSGVGSSDGGEHLVEARNELILNRHTSRDGSEEDEAVVVIPPTPEPEHEPEAGPSRRTMSGGEEHAWDSVWPTPETVYRAITTPTTLESRFPTAPVSPFVTPSFSPAIMPVGARSAPTRRATSPTLKPSSPRGRFSPLPRAAESFEGPNLGRRRSITATTDPPSLSSRHQRSLSSSSPTGSIRRSLTPPSSSPPRSPRKRPASPRQPQRKITAPQPSRLHESTEDIPDLNAIPPPVAELPMFGPDDGVAKPPIFSPAPRPSVRRALSDYDRMTPQDLTPLSVETSVELVDEGDVLPDVDLLMDITFEDEGLNTLERIFLLSKSDFGFHRAYIARVLGDLLYDVDPCESVEYVLPLISQYACDPDEGVKEAFAEELHRVIWYFFAVCRIADPGTSPAASPMETLTVTSEGMQMMERPDEPEEVTMAESSASTLMTDIRTPGTFDETTVVDRPTLPVNFFTALIGSMLLSANALIAESIRQGLVLVIRRLKGGEVDQERWGTRSYDDERQVFLAQNGLHTHDIRPIPPLEVEMIERELIDGIVVGMGRLSTEIPELTEEDDAEEISAQILAEALAGRATSMNLVGALCGFLPGPDAVNWAFVDEVLRCSDGDIPVRAEGAVALSMLAKIIPVEHVHRLVPLFEALSNDDVAQVRQSSCLALPAICRRIEPFDLRRSFAVNGIIALTGYSADVRCAALEVLGELIHAFAEDPAGPPAELMAVYTDEDTVLGTDWDTVASFNLPGVALTLGSARWAEVQPLYQRLCDRSTLKVRRSLAASLHELAKILTPDQVVRDLMPVYKTCITSEDEVRELVFEHVDVFLSNMPLDVAWSTYLELGAAWRENRLGGWRAREQLALHIGTFYKLFHDLMSEEVLEMMEDALLDKFAAVRDAATKGIPESYEILGDQSGIAKRFRETLLSLGKSAKFRERLTFVRCLREFVKPPPNRQAFEDFFLPFLKSLSKDVVDVRLGLAQTVADLFVVGAFYADQTHAPAAIYDLAQLLSTDEAVDVRETVRRVNLRHLEENGAVPYEIKSPESAKRAITPSDLAPEHPPNTLHLPRRQSSEMSRTLRQLQLTPSHGLGIKSPVRGEGHWISSPSPNEPSGEMDPFSMSFGQATPENGSPAGSLRGLDSPRRGVPMESPLRGLGVVPLESPLRMLVPVESPGGEAEGSRGD